MKFLTLGLMLVYFLLAGGVQASEDSKWWPIQSIDTMKYSRDLAREMAPLGEAHIKLIDKQMEQIAGTGATHAAIATPYDGEFEMVLARWVQSAREHNLRVWLRGNFAGWEGWFGYPRIDRSTHKAMLEKWLGDHAQLLQDGDIFTPCPECENGGPGDPRQTNDVTGYRNFMIEEYGITNRYFESHNLAVQSNLISMNGDIARLVMDEDTTEAMDGWVTIDHYVKDPESLSNDARKLAKLSGGKVVLGEMGVPIPSINGAMTETEQAEWLDLALADLAREPKVLGINYWVGHGGSTRLWETDGEARLAVDILEKYFKPKTAEGKVLDEKGKPLSGVRIETDWKHAESGEDGNFIVPILDRETATLTKDGYETQTATAGQTEPVVLKKVVSLPKWCFGAAWLARICQLVSQSL